MVFTLSIWSRQGQTNATYLGAGGGEGGGGGGGRRGAKNNSSGCTYRPATPASCREKARSEQYTDRTMGGTAAVSRKKAEETDCERRRRSGAGRESPRALRRELTAREKPGVAELRLFPSVLQMRGKTERVSRAGKRTTIWDRMEIKVSCARDAVSRVSP
jgi:hypothetical protein